MLLPQLLLLLSNLFLVEDATVVVVVAEAVAVVVVALEADAVDGAVVAESVAVFAVNVFIRSCKKCLKFVRCEKSRKIERKMFIFSSRIPFYSISLPSD
jgi:hypothetical protein